MTGVFRCRHSRRALPHAVYELHHVFEDVVFAHFSVLALDVWGIFAVFLEFLALKGGPQDGSFGAVDVGGEPSCHASSHCGVNQGMAVCGAGIIIWLLAAYKSLEIDLVPQPVK